MRQQPISLEAIPRVKPGLPHRCIDGEVILVDPSQRRVYHFDDIATYYLQCMDGQKSLSAILSDALRTYDVEAGEAERDLIDLVQELLQADIVQLDADAR